MGPHGSHTHDEVGRERSHPQQRLCVHLMKELSMKKLMGFALMAALAAFAIGCSEPAPPAKPVTTTPMPMPVPMPGAPTPMPAPGTTTPGDGTEKPADGTEKPADGTEKPADGTDEKPDGTDEKPAEPTPEEK